MNAKSLTINDLHIDNIIFLILVKNTEGSVRLNMTPQYFCNWAMAFYLPFFLAAIFFIFL
jgi:hypothetical protein